MSWLARLGFAEALRWALVWPALIVGAAAVSLVIAAVTHFAGDWAVALPSTGPVPLWLATVLALCAVLFGPSLAFLALWTVARG